MEIGSEFWYENIANRKEKNNWSFGVDRKLLLSGRTAIDYILDEILLTKEIKTVYFPSYCCSSMLQPFLDRKITVIFYDVCFKNTLTAAVDNTQECDIFFAMNYFGFSDFNMDENIENFKKKGTIIIEDATHSLLSKRRYNNNSNYVIASLRKWFPIISGAIAISNEKNFITKIDETKNNIEMIELRKKAMILKNKYINGAKVEKKDFLSLYKESNLILADNYKNMLIDEQSKNILLNIDIESIRKNRIRNAKIIYKNLSNSKIIPMFSINEEKDCPIFVPVILQNKSVRDTLKEYLISKNIYCPIHWPLQNMIDETQIYDTELSLICDHRYTEEDISNYVDILNKF